MSEDRRRQQQRERVRRRREQRPVVSTAIESSAIEMPGIFGWMQRNGRILIIGGIVTMVLGIGGKTFFGDLAKPMNSGSTATATATVEGGRPVGTPAADGVVRQYTGAPPMQLDPTKQYEAIFRTEKGDFRAELLPDAAPSHVNNFVFLAKNKFFDGLTFHRVLPNFVAQGGDPLGTGSGGPGYSLPEERNKLQFDPGILAMASNPRTGVSGSQFFITLAPQPQLEPSFAAFGRVIEGMEVVRALTLRNPDQPQQPPGDRILKVDIVEKAR